jgi:SAM-dependent methyltransferase
MKWFIKAAFQKTISYIPGYTNINYFFQSEVSKNLPRNDQQFFDIINEGILHYKICKKYNRFNNLSDANFFEFGAGWDLIIPILYSCIGVKSQTIVDLYLNVRYDLIEDTLSRIRKDREKIEALCQNKINVYDTIKINSLDDLDRHFGIRYLAPYDARKTNFQDESFDFISNTATLEHIPYEDLIQIFYECHRILKKNGIISCLIDLKDHYSYFDKSISYYNFLKFGENSFKYINSSVFYQNRLRYKDYIEIFKKCNYKIIYEKIDFPDTNDIEILKNLKINKKFDLRDYQNLGVKGIHIVLKKN